MRQFLKPGKEPTFKQNIVVNKEDAGGRCHFLQYARFTFPYFLIKRIKQKIIIIKGEEWAINLRGTKRNE